MDIYTPLFSKIVDSSLWDEPDYVIKIFITLIAKKDADFVVRGSAYNIGKWSRKPEAEVLKALKILSSPDTKRIEPQPEEGRRVKKVEGGWLIINGKFYQDLMRLVNRRAYKAEKEREYRLNRKLCAGMDNGKAKAAERRIERNENLSGTEFADKAQEVDDQK